ncbi:MAG TPA: hypothetical protein VMD09_10080 [Solirubrobacteraceae bacterium]|nr:hypothetical protein [Solirubrobacteraceae bacterium]
MSQLKAQILALDQSLSGFGANDLPQWRIGQMANVLIAQARDAAADSPVIKAVEDFQPRSDHEFVDGARMGTLRATLRQVAEALPPDPPVLDRAA